MTKLHQFSQIGVGIAQRNVWACGQKPRGGWIGFL